MWLTITFDLTEKKCIASRTRYARNFYTSHPAPWYRVLPLNDFCSYLSSSISHSGICKWDTGCTTKQTSHEKKLPSVFFICSFFFNNCYTHIASENVIAINCFHFFDDFDRDQSSSWELSNATMNRKEIELWFNLLSISRESTEWLKTRKLQKKGHYTSLAATAR